MPPVTNGVSTNTVMHRPPATSPPDQEAQAKRPEKDVLLLCVCAGYSRHPWRDPGPVVVTSEPGGEPIEPRVVHSSPSSEHCSHTQWCVAGTLPDHQEELSCLTAPCLAAPACSVRPLTAARSSAACVQTACDVLLTFTTDNHGCAITMCVKMCSHPVQGAPGRYYPPALA